jgi:hypothetical protein
MSMIVEVGNRKSEFESGLGANQDLQAVNEANKCFFPLLGRSHKFFLADESD